MNRDDARAFIVALNAVQQYVPPLIFNQLISNPICNAIQEVANAVPSNVEQFRKPDSDAHS